MDKVLLKKYLQNCCSKDELFRVLNWFENNADTSEGKSLLYEIWEEMKLDSTDAGVDYDLILNSIHQKINPGTGKAGRRNVISIRSRFIRILRNTAAIMLLPVAAAGFYMSHKYNSVVELQNSPVIAYNEVFSSVDAITKVALPDGSIVWLNHSSSLRYPATFRNDSRTVELKGEGFFEVAHNPDSPFIVSTGSLDIVAVGTTFNVLAYPDESKIETSLLEGKVILQKKSSGGAPDFEMVMKPSEMVVYCRNEEEFLTHEISDDRYFSWKDGRIVFNEEPMEEVVKKLSRWFNVEINIQDQELNELTFTGTFINETLYEVMELITLITPADYSISSRHETGQGTFSKRKVTLYNKKSANSNKTLMP